MTISRSFGCLACCVLACACANASGFNGKWRGTYNGQPTALMPDGSYPETTKAFEIRLHESRRKIAGSFRSLDRPDADVLPIQHGQRFGDHACFNVLFDNEDMRWCVTMSGNQLTGTWSRGPEGGPLLKGAGAGARLFEIKATKAD